VSGLIFPTVPKAERFSAFLSDSDAALHAFVQGGFIHEKPVETDRVFVLGRSDRTARYSLRNYTASKSTIADGNPLPWPPPPRPPAANNNTVLTADGNPLPWPPPPLPPAVNNNAVLTADGNPLPWPPPPQPPVFA